MSYKFMNNFFFNLILVNSGGPEKTMNLILSAKVDFHYIILSNHCFRRLINCEFQGSVVFINAGLIHFQNSQLGLIFLNSAKQSNLNLDLTELYSLTGK